MATKTRNKARWEDFSGGLVVRGYQAGRSDGLAVVHRSDYVNDGGIYLNGAVGHLPDRESFFQAAKAIMAADESGVRIGMPTSEVKALPGIFALTVGTPQFEVEIGRDCLRLSDECKADDEGLALRPHVAFQLAGHMDEIKRLRGLLA